MRRVVAGSLASCLLGAVTVGGAGGQTAPRHEVQVQMRNVSFHVDSTIVIAIHAARGELRRADPAHAPYLDDKRSVVLALDTARIGISPAALGMVLNRYTFAYPGADLRKL